MSKSDNVPKDNKTGVVLGEALETTLRYLAIRTKERKIQDTIRRLLLRDPDVIATAEEYGIDLGENKVERGGPRHVKQGQGEVPQATKPSAAPNGASTGIVEQDRPIKPATPKGFVPPIGYGPTKPKLRTPGSPVNSRNGHGEDN